MNYNSDVRVLFLVSLIMREKAKAFFDKIKEKIKKRVQSSPTYAKFIRVRDENAQRIHTALLAFFDIVGPFWNFFFLKTPNPDKKTNENRKNVIQSHLSNLWL